MTDIGVRELKIHASDIIREVREEQTRYIITHRGRPVAAIVPIVEPVMIDEPSPDAWEELTRLGDEISRAWKSSLSGAEILSEMRR